MSTAATLSTTGLTLARVFTDFALNTPGITAGFKVYVILDTGREAGSVARFVTRPV